MFDPSPADPVSPALHALLQLFADELSEVTFPGLDADVLEAAAEQVRAKAAAVARAQAALDAATAELHDTQEALLQKGQRALAYLRVYAEEHPELGPQVEAIQLPRAPRKVAPGGVSAGLEEAPLPKRRGRPPKVRPAPSLFAESTSVAPETAAG